jgi:hypothetical protein
MPAGLHNEWMGHLCGLCLTLRDRHGQPARVVTNYDALAVSALWAAQLPAPPPTVVASPCPLRGFRRAEVLASDGSGPAFGAAMARLMAATKLHDHLADGDSRVSRVDRPVRWVADRWATEAVDAARRLGFREDLVTGQVARSRAF